LGDESSRNIFIVFAVKNFSIIKWEKKIIAVQFQMLSMLNYIRRNGNVKMLISIFYSLSCFVLRTEKAHLLLLLTTCIGSGWKDFLFIFYKAQEFF